MPSIGIQLTFITNDLVNEFPRVWCTSETLKDYLYSRNGLVEPAEPIILDLSHERRAIAKYLAIVPTVVYGTSTILEGLNHLHSELISEFKTYDLPRVIAISWKELESKGVDPVQICALCNCIFEQRLGWKIINLDNHLS